MARSTAGGGGFLKILLLIVLILVLIFGGLLWFDFLGVLDMKDSLAPVRRLIGLGQVTEIEDDGGLYLLDNERLKKQQEAIDLRYEELKGDTEALNVALSELEQREQQLGEKENALKEKEKSLNQELKQYENEVRNLKSVAGHLMGMPPESAVAQLSEMDEYHAVKLLRSSLEISSEAGSAPLVPYWLSLMEPEKAASLQTKLIQSPGGEDLAEEQWFSD